jgi:putative endonuclease
MQASWQALRMRQDVVYILANRRYGVLYFGVTNDLVRRMFEHQNKLADGFTKKHGVVQLVYFEQYSHIDEARARERSVKRWRRAWKLKLIDEFNPDWRDLSREFAA